MMLRELSVGCRFRNGFLQTFPSVVRKERAQALLETRVQLPSENVAIFTEKMTRLFKHADPEMSEEKEVRFLTRGVKQELFAGLIRNPPRTVPEFLAEATAIEKTLEIRTIQYNRHVLTPQREIHLMGPQDLRETIRAVEREELRRTFPSSLPQMASITDVVRDEIRQSLGVPQSPQAEPEGMT